MTALLAAALGGLLSRDDIPRARAEPEQPPPMRDRSVRDQMLSKQRKLEKRAERARIKAGIPGSKLARKAGALPGTSVRVRRTTRPRPG